MQAQLKQRILAKAVACFYAFTWVIWIARRAAHHYTVSLPFAMDVEHAMDATTLGWIAAILLIIVGLAGTILPALPGTILVLAGIVLGAWLDDFTRVKWWVVAIIAVLAVVAWVTDYLATVMGAKKAGASTLAIVGAALGTIAGIFMGLIGVLFMPFVGAVIGEYIAQKNAKQAAKVGLATWLGLLIGTVVKLVLVFMMIGIFVAALLVTA